MALAEIKAEAQRITNVIGRNDKNDKPVTRELLDEEGLFRKMVKN